MTRPDPTVVLDDIDKALVEALQHDSRLPYTKLAAEVKLSEAAVRQRVQRLIESGVVQVVAVTDPMTVGYHRMAMVGLRIEGDVRAIADALGAIPGVVSTETFTYLKLFKQTHGGWATR